MNELTPQAIVCGLITKGNELIGLSKQTCIFRASVAYLAQHILRPCEQTLKFKLYANYKKSLSITQLFFRISVNQNGYSRR
jgi:hypothetical protein